jgi:hypothetical protein
LCEKQPYFVPLFVHEIATRLGNNLKINLMRSRRPEQDDAPL